MWCATVHTYITLRSANHSVISVLSTTQCYMIHQLVYMWYAHFIFYSVATHTIL